MRQHHERLSDRDIAWQWDKGSHQWVEGWRPVYTKEGERRRKACKKDLAKFLKTYAEPSFRLRFSEDHKQFIRLVQAAIVEGLLAAFALPRGSGKTTILRLAVLWAAIYGYHPFSMLAAADDPKARRMLKNIKSQLERNHLLNADFPEVCGPIRMLEGSAIRATYQQFDGVSTDLVFAADLVVLPTIPASVERGNAGAIIGVGGIETAIRGANYTRPSTGESIRPSLVLVDDPQTRKTAKSELTTSERLAIITGDMLGLAPPDRDMSALVAGTVIFQRDLMEQLLDPQQCPGWQPIRVSMLKVWPVRMDLWEQYKQLRLQAHTEKRPPTEANAFYRANRKAMDEGAVVYWPDRKKPSDISAIQTALNIWIDDPITFASEYQNSPIDPHVNDSSALALTEDIVIKAIHEVPAGTVPIESHKLFSMIDVGQLLLWFKVIAVDEQFGSVSVVNSGTWPPQRGYVTKDKVDLSLQSHYGLPLRDSIRSGLNDLMAKIMGTTYETPGGESVPVSLGCVDARWGEMCKLVRDTVWSSPYSSTWYPSEGLFVGAKKKAMNDLKTKPERREVRGVNWRIEPEKEGRRLLYDVNYWKTFSAELWHEGVVNVFAGSVRSHRMLIDHLISEYPTEMKGPSRTVNEWTLRPGQGNEHFWDCFVGCMVLASVSGIQVVGEKPTAKTKKPRLKFSEVMGGR